MNTLKTIKQIPISERPYERCERYGAEYLSDAELLSVLLRSGTKSKPSIDLARELLMIKDSNEGLCGLTKATMNELMKIKGIGKVKAIQILCVVELTKRISRMSVKKGIIFNSPKSIADYFMQDMRSLDMEQITLVLLNAKNKMIKHIRLSKGTVNAALTTPREVFVCALKYEAVNIVILHNHPSGDPTPSKEDVALTNRLVDTGRLIGINLIDHIIIGDNTYASLKEMNLM